MGEKTVIHEVVEKQKEEDTKESLEEKSGSSRFVSKVNTEAVSTSCKYCPFTLSGNTFFKARLRMHNRTEHHVCEICQNRHKDSSELEMHMNSLHECPTGGFVCGVDGCDKKIPELYKVLVHVREFHNKVADRICLECGIPYSRLRTHRRHYHNELKKSLKTCKQCGYTCITTSNMAAHKRVKHPKLGQPSRKFACSLCEFQTSGNSQNEEFKLIVHNRVHHAGEIICTLCPYKTEKPYAIGRHLAEVHNVGRVALCNQCDYKAGGAFGEIMLRRHMARHTQERNFQCDQCEFRGYTKYDLGKHYYNRHEVNPPKYVCNDCDYTSNDSSNFKAHQEAKHGSWISCKECDYQTKSRRALREHKKKHSANLDFPPFQ